MLHDRTSDKNTLFDAYEMRLLELFQDTQSRAQEWAYKAQTEYTDETDALYAYVEHMTALSHARAYLTALYEYRQYSIHKLVSGRKNE